MSGEDTGAEILSNQAEAPTETPAPESAPAVGEASSNETSWIDSIDEEYRPSIEARGLSDNNTLAKSYVNLVKLHGNNPNVVALPGEDATDEVKADFYKALGRPEDASKYQMDIPEGMPFDEAFNNSFREMAFENGLTSEQVKNINDWHNGQMSGQIDDQSQSALVQADQDIATLRGEWGGAYDSKMAEGRAAVNMLGVEDQMLNQLEMAMGTGSMLRFFQDIGSKIGEDVVLGEGDNEFAGGMTPNQAKTEMEALSSDFKTSLIDPSHANHKANTERWKTLNRYAHG
jgi:hypothetical protein